MKQVLVTLFSILSLAGSGQEFKKDSFPLSVSPLIRKENPTHHQIIGALQAFLHTKNTSLTQNLYWLASNFTRYRFPYLDIYHIEQSRFGPEFYKPALLEIIPTENPNRKIIKLAFIGHQPATGENYVRSLYTLVANLEGAKVLFSRYLDYATAKWQTLVSGSITYRISPQRQVNHREIERQQSDLETICRFFGTEPVPFTYYSCVNPQELFQIKGFDYHPNMHSDETGGLTESGNLLFSGNNSEKYTHEVVHIYTANLFPAIPGFFNEGVATYIGGTGHSDYAWHRDKLKKFLDEHRDFNVAAHTDPYERLYYEKETPVPYVTAALVCERTCRIYGKDKLLELFKSTNELWETLIQVGLTKENIHTELRKELARPLTPAF